MRNNLFEWKQPCHICKMTGKVYDINEIKNLWRKRNLKFKEAMIEYRYYKRTGFIYCPYCGGDGIFRYSLM